MELRHSLDIKFKKDYYDKDLKRMYHFSMSKDYFLDDKAEVLKEAIKDLQEELRLLEMIDKNNDRAKESWESISK